MDAVTYAVAKNAAKKYTDTKTEALVGGLTYKGSVSTQADLPASGNQKGDAYNCSDGSGMFVWNGTAWTLESKAGPQGPPGPKGEDGAHTVSVSATGTSTNQVKYITIDGVESKITTEAFKPMKSAWCGSNLTTAQAAEAILADSSVLDGDAFAGEVEWSDLSDIGLMNGEATARVGGNKTFVLFEMSSSDTTPYYWQFNSFAGVWRKWSEVIANPTGTPGNTLSKISIDGTSYSIGGGLPAGTTAGEALIFDGTNWSKQTGYGYTTSGSAWGSVEMDLTYEEGMYADYWDNNSKQITVGTTYSVNFNGTTYTLVGAAFEDYGFVGIGDITLQEYPFAIVNSPNEDLQLLIAANVQHVAISITSGSVVKIDDKYINLPNLQIITSSNTYTDVYNAISAGKTLLMLDSSNETLEYVGSRNVVVSGVERYTYVFARPNTDDDADITLEGWEVLDNNTWQEFEGNLGVSDVTVNGTSVVSSGVAALTVVDNTSSTSTSAPLSAHMGKELQDEINNLKNIGRFLAIWNSATGLPLTNPTTMPYTYKTGDYYRVGVVAEGSANNYKPNGASYSGTASTTVETEDVEVGWVYYYDGSQWLAQSAGGGGTVQDVQVNGTSIVASGTGIANIPNSSSSVNGVMTSAQYTKLDGIQTNAITLTARVSGQSYPSGTFTYVAEV